MAIERIERPQSLYEMALEGIRSAIVDGSIELGEHLSEFKVSQRLGISKTPVREALQELRREGLVQIDPQSGTTVFLPDERELNKIFDMRILLEIGAAQRMFREDYAATAAKVGKVVDQMQKCVTNQDYTGYRHLDSSFHNLIIAGANNSLISDAYRPLSSKIDSLRSRGLKSLKVVDKSLDFHKRLLELLAAGKSDKFCAGLEEHIRNSCLDYLAWFSQSDLALLGKKGPRYIAAPSSSNHRASATAAGPWLPGPR